MEKIPRCDETQMNAIIREVSNSLGYGRREKVYQNALCYSLNLNGLDASVEVPHPVYYKGYCVGTTFIDIMCATCLIEVKYVKTLNDIHRAQVSAYARDCEQDAVLVNFGAKPVEIEYIKFSDLPVTNN